MNKEQITKCKLLPEEVGFLKGMISEAVAEFNCEKKLFKLLLSMILIDNNNQLNYDRKKYLAVSYKYLIAMQ